MKRINYRHTNLPKQILFFAIFLYIIMLAIIMLEIAVRHTREENYAHTQDWKKPYDGSMFDMFKDGTFELVDLSNPFGRGNPLWPSNGDFHIDRVQHMPMHYRLLQTFNSFHMHNSTHADSPSHVIPESPFTHELPIENYFGEAVCLDSSYLNPFATLILVYLVACCTCNLTP